jgi:hypothetical protein
LFIIGALVTTKARIHREIPETWMCEHKSKMAQTSKPNLTKFSNAQPDFHSNGINHAASYSESAPHRRIMYVCKVRIPGSQVAATGRYLNSWQIGTNTELSS